MSHVVDKLQTKLLRIFTINLLEALPDPVHYCLPVRKGIVNSTSHRLDIIPCLVATPRSTRKFAVRQVYAVFVHSPFHNSQVIGTHLMTVAARTTVNHNRNLSFMHDTERLGSP